MATLHSVNPERFVTPDTGKPPTGRGAWTRAGIEFNYRYTLAKEPAQRIGTRAEVSLDHWAVAAGSYAIQLRLVELNHMTPPGDAERGIFGPRTVEAVREFQGLNSDPDGNADLTVDGVVGRSDARALFTPLIRKAEAKYSIPHSLLVGETNHESGLDPGAVGYYIYYPDFRGVDRGMSQINSKANNQVSWLNSYNPWFSSDWSAARLRDYFDRFKKSYPKQPDSVLWDAAVCAHNNPSAAGSWAAKGHAPTDSAALYVTSVKNAVYGKSEGADQ